MPYKPEFFSGLIFTTAQVMFIIVRSLSFIHSRTERCYHTRYNVVSLHIERIRGLDPEQPHKGQNNGSNPGQTGHGNFFYFFPETMYKVLKSLAHV